MKLDFCFCLFYVLIIILLIILSGFLFMSLWNWLVPLFWVSCPILNIWESIGILYLIALIKGICKK